MEQQRYQAQKKILAVDDDPNMQRLVAATLGGRLYHVITAGSGAEALEYARRERPALAIIDTSLPDMDGYTLLTRLRTQLVTRMASIFLTGRTLPETQQQGRAAGADAFLTKPFSPLQLLQLVEQLVGNS